jgi:hypothetical protein
LVREIRSYCKQLKDYKLIEACVAKLWTEFTNENVDNEIKLQWTKHIESKIDVLYKQIDNLIIESSKLLIRPMEVKELNDLKIKLAEQQIKIGEALKHDSEVFVQKKKNEIDLNVSFRALFFLFLLFLGTSPTFERCKHEIGYVSRIRNIQ